MKDNLNFCKPIKGFLFHELALVESFTNLKTGKVFHSQKFPLGIWYNQEEDESLKEKYDIKNDFEVGRFCCETIKIDN